MNSAFIIVNPAAGRGQARTLMTSIRHAFSVLGVTDIRETHETGEEELMANKALAAGVKTIIAVGGDGTCSRVANAILHSGGLCRLAVIPCGTGNDFAKTLGVVRRTPQQIAELVAGATPTTIDVGLCDGYYFLNSCGFGFDASVLEATRRVRFLKGDAVYIYSALRQLFTYRGISVSVDASVDTMAARMLMLTVSNGRYLGGAFRIAPQASVIDGKLDVGFFGDIGLIGRVRLFAGAFRGTHVGLPSVKTKLVRNDSSVFRAPDDGTGRRAKAGALVDGEDRMCAEGAQRDRSAGLPCLIHPMWRAIRPPESSLVQCRQEPPLSPDSQKVGYHQSDPRRSASASGRSPRLMG